MDFGGEIQELTRVAGDAWMLALVGAFFVMVCESAKPKRAEGEERPKFSNLALLVSVLSLATPVLLFMHAFIAAGRSPGSLVLTGAAIGVTVIGAAIIGWIIAAAAAPAGRLLNRAAPILAVVVFAFTLWVTWRSAYEVIERYMLGRMGA